MIQRALVCALTCMFLSPVFAASECSSSFSFSADISDPVGNTTTSSNRLCDSKADVFIDNFQNLGKFSNAYQTKNEGVQINARFLDVDLFLAYQPNTASLTYRFPQLGIRSEIQGQGASTALARQDAESQFVDLVKRTDLAGQLIKYQAQNSPSSGISGPGGLIPNMISQDFSQSTSGPNSTVQRNSSIENSLSLEVESADYRLDSGQKVNVVSLPLSYTIRLDSNPQHQVMLSLPLTATDIDGAKSYQVGLGLGYRLPITGNWALVPAARYSVVGSADRATVAGVYSDTLTSVYSFEMFGMKMAYGAMVGTYQTAKFETDDFRYDPDIENNAFKNGLVLSQSFALLGNNLSAEYSISDTRYFGSEKPFLSDFQEVGVTLGTNNACWKWMVSCVSV